MKHIDFSEFDKFVYNQNDLLEVKSRIEKNIENSREEFKSDIENSRRMFEKEIEDKQKEFEKEIIDKQKGLSEFIEKAEKRIKKFEEYDLENRKNLKFLICDDAGFMRAMVADELVKNGYTTIEEAENGQLGVEVYKEIHPDMTFMDITMPVMDGLQALKEIEMICPNAHVVILAAMGQEFLARDAIGIGAFDVIFKPFRPESVLRPIRRLEEEMRRHIDI